MEQKFKYSIPPIVLLALIFAITSEYCQPISASPLIPSIQNPPPFNPACHIASFKPESPEIQTSNPEPLRNSASFVTASGTATTLASPSFSFEIPES